MTKETALMLCLAFILWLFYRDRKLRPMTSWASWIPLLWIMIIGSRSITGWLGASVTTIDPNQGLPSDYIEGSPLDRNIFLFLIVSGLIVLWQRRVDWGRILRSNVWLFVFFLYCGVSVVWSDFAFVSFKRWIKDLGNIVMVLVIITEQNPVQALKAVFARYIYFAVPLSVLLIKYFPDLGRYYHRFTFTPTYCGIATNKNELGIILMVSGLVLVWDLIERKKANGRIRRDSVDLMVRVVLLVMILWLLHLASSATATVSLMLGTLILLFVRLRSVKLKVRKYLGIYSLATALLILMLYSFPFITEGVVAMIGRDVTLTGRTRIWADLLSQPLNPLLGMGYKSFWMGPALERLQINQAHNGYIETYLNGGMVGLCLLIAVIVSTGKKLKKELLAEDNFEMFRFSFFIVAIFYNVTEAMFNGLSLIWFVLLLAALYYPPAAEAALKAEPKKVRRVLAAVR